MNPHQAALLRLECLKLAIQIRTVPHVRTEPFTEIGITQSATIFADFVLQNPAERPQKSWLERPSRNLDWRDS